MIVPISLPFGRQEISFTLPEANLVGVLNPRPVPACADPQAEIGSALDHPFGTQPISEIVRPGEKILILVDDYTRPTPTQLILPHLLERLHSCGVHDSEITFLVSTGTHRPCNPGELREKLGETVLAGFPVYQHDCLDTGSQVFMGLTGRGTPVWVNRLVVQADRVFGIGHIDPSDYAGYAGGRKLIVPGVAALGTVDANHSLACLSFRQYGRVDLPCRKDIDEAGSLVRVDQLINVVLCRDGQIAQAFAGSPEEVYRRGVALAKQVYEVECPWLVDFAVVSGYPYDMDFYQAIRAIEYGDVIVRPGGSILLAAPCQDGVGSESFYRLLAEPGLRPDDFLRNITRREGKVTYNVLGYFLATIRAEKELYGYMPGIPAEQLEAIQICPVASLQEGVDALLQKYGLQAKAAVLPVGSATVPHITGSLESEEI